MSAPIEPKGTKVFVSQGLIDGVEFVDIVTANSDPIDYAIPLPEAIAEYGNCRKVGNPSEDSATAR